MPDNDDVGDVSWNSVDLSKVDFKFLSTAIGQFYSPQHAVELLVRGGFILREEAADALHYLDVYHQGE